MTCDGARMFLKAVGFDLYGTLAVFNQRAFLEDLRRALGKPAERPSSDHLRRLLVTPAGDESGEAAAWCRAAGVAEPTPAQVAVARGVLDRHRALVAPVEGMKTLLAFLRRRGLRLGVLSNASAAFRGPVATLGLDKALDVVLFSCDIGFAKPDPRAFQRLVLDLGVQFEECLFIGDSRASDLEAARRLGIPALLVGAASAEVGRPARRLSDVAWMSWNAGASPESPLAGVGTRFSIDGRSWVIESFETLADGSQGRHNVVAKVGARDPDGREGAFYAKRYGDPASAHVEDMAYRLMRLWDATECAATILPCHEPILLVSAAVGQVWDPGHVSVAAAEQIGRHCGFAYLMGNADLRPRNVFLETNAGLPRLSVIDLEHCFFDRALALGPDVDALRPESIDAMAEGIEARTRHRVVSAAGTRRTRRAFLPVEDRADPRALAFRRGWIDAFSVARGRAPAAEALLRSRLRVEPPMIIGTQSYRRAMASIDVSDVLLRIHEDPAARFEVLY